MWAGWLAESDGHGVLRFLHPRQKRMYSMHCVLGDSALLLPSLHNPRRSSTVLLCEIPSNFSCARSSCPPLARFRPSGSPSQPCTSEVPPMFCSPCCRCCPPSKLVLSTHAVSVGSRKVAGTRVRWTQGGERRRKAEQEEGGEGQQEARSVRDLLCPTFPARVNA